MLKYAHKCSIFIDAAKELKTRFFLIYYTNFDKYGVVKQIISNTCFKCLNYTHKIFCHSYLKLYCVKL